MTRTARTFCEAQEMEIELRAIRRGLAALAEAKTEIERLRAINAELLAALELMVVRLSQFYEFHGPIDVAAFATAAAAIAKSKAS